MLGAIIGDIAGSRFEFNPTNDYDFELLDAACDFTDDTICTVAVADALLRGRDFAESIHEWCRKYPDPTGGYGGRFATWVHSNDPKPYNSFGNGAAMRVSPVAWAYTNMSKILPVAEATAACTHNHPEGIKGAQTVAMAIRKGIELNECYGSFGETQMKELLKICVDFSGYNIRLRKEDVQNKFDETCQGTVPVALWIIAQSHGFEDAVRRAVSLGADADTLGAIVGSMAEAIWGIPDDLMLEVLDFLPEDMKHVVLRFYSRYMKNNVLHGYGDEGAARDLMLEEEVREMQQETADNDELKEYQAIMHWKLGLGHMGKYFNGENPMPPKKRMAVETSWKIEPMPSTDVSTMKVSINISLAEMSMIRKGHIPEAQEDHWFMYCTEEHIRYYRSWTGMCAYEAHYRQEEGKFIIDEVVVNQGLVEFGVNGDEPALYLFIYLLTAESGGDASSAWKAYIEKWEENYYKYKPAEEKEEEKKQEKDDVIDSFNKKQPQDTWFVGIKNHVCDGCIYAKGIRRWDDDPEKGVMGCGRLGYNSFRRNYTGDSCEYRKTDLETPSEYELERIEEAKEQKRKEEEEKLRQYKQRKRLEKLEKEDGSYDRQLVSDFINEKLDGDINKLADFDFGTLVEDKRFGNCKGFAFSVDKCDVVQAIQSLAFGDVWPELNMNTVEDYTYTCSSIHQMHYLFGANILDQYFKGMQKFSPTKEQHERAIRVSHLQRHIGNIWILPKGIDHDKDTYVYHGYVDKWLKAVYDVMTGDKSADGGLKGTLYQVRKQMVNYQGTEGFQKMMDDLLLEDFIDEEGKPKQVLPYVWSMMKGLSKEEYFKAVDAYCSFMEGFIPKRSRMIAEKVHYMLAHDNMIQLKHIARMIEEEDNNEYAKVGYRYMEVLDRIAAEKDQKDKSVLFETLDSMRLEDGFSLGIRLAEDEGIGDESWFYIYRKDGKIVYDDIPEPLDGEGGFGMNHVFVEKTKMGAWQTYLFSIASTVLPTFWHGGYIRRTYIFKHDDLKDVITTHNLGEAPLYGIKDDIQPKVKIRGNEATVQCCYWNEWEGLVRETMLVKFSEGTVLSIERKDNEVLFEYDCGICF